MPHAVPWQAGAQPLRPGASVAQLGKKGAPMAIGKQEGAERGLGSGAGAKVGGPGRRPQPGGVWRAPRRESKAEAAAAEARNAAQRQDTRHRRRSARLRHHKRAQLCSSTPCARPAWKHAPGKTRPFQLAENRSMKDTREAQESPGPHPCCATAWPAPWRARSHGPQSPGSRQ